MLIKTDFSGTLDAFRLQLDVVLADPKVEGLFILASEENGFTADQVNPLLAEIPVPVFGGIFPKLIAEKQLLAPATIVIGLSKEPIVHIFPNLSTHKGSFEDLIDRTIPDNQDSKTMFVFVDGFCPCISEFIDSLFFVFGTEHNYIGGGAGAIKMPHQPCLFTNQGLLQDSAVLAFVDIASGIGSAHGWHETSQPYKVTESDHNLIKTLDWKPPFEIYRDAVNTHAKKQITADNFSEVARAYPFGISILGTEKIIRDPVALEGDGAIRCIGEVPAGSYVQIMHGDTESLIVAAQQAAQLGQDAFDVDLPGKQLHLMIDCISRVLFLENDFQREIDAVHREGIPLIGAATIGEIANSGRDFLEFYNKTIVIGVMEDE